MRKSSISMADNPVCDIASQYVDRPSPSTSLSARPKKTVAALHAALLCLLDRSSLDKITIDAIALEAGVHRATFFRHFPTQRDLLDDVAGEQIEQLSEFTVSILRDHDGFAATKALFAYIEDHRRVWSALLGGAEGAMRARLNAYSMKLAKAEFPELGDTATSLYVKLSSSIIIDSIGWWLAREPDSTDYSALAGIVDELLTTVQKIQYSHRTM